MDDKTEPKILTPVTGKLFLSESDTYWSAKDLAAKFGTDPGTVNKIMKGLAQAGAIAHYYIPFKMFVGGESIDAKKYFYANWDVKPSSSFLLANSQFSHLAKHGVAVKPGADTGNHGTVLIDKPHDEAVPSSKEIFVKYVAPKYNELPPTNEVVVAPTQWKPEIATSKWMGTYKTSKHFESVPVVKHLAVPPEHVLDFLKHYQKWAFTMRFLANYFDCTIGHMSKTVKALPPYTEIDMWFYKTMNVVQGQKNPDGHTAPIIDLPKVAADDPIKHKTLLTDGMNKAIAELEFQLALMTAKPVSSGHITGKIDGATKSIYSIPKFVSDPTKKVQFEVGFTKKPSTPPPTIEAPAFLETTTASTLWDLKPLNLLRECADLYILNDLSLDFDEIKPMFEAKRDFLAEQFSRYLDMAIGGEIRDGWNHCGMLDYHRGKLKIVKYLDNGSIPYNDRAKAQAAWKKVREELGMEALEEAYTFFNGGGWGGSYGGPKWAVAVKTLMSYLKGEYSKMTFVDTVWALQHNCDYILDKAWQVNGLANVLQLKQDGCMVDLHKFASPAVAKIWKEKRQQ